MRDFIIFSIITIPFWVPIILFVCSLFYQKGAVPLSIAVLTLSLMDILILCFIRWHTGWPKQFPEIYLYLPLLILSVLVFVCGYRIYRARKKRN